MYESVNWRVKNQQNWEPSILQITPSWRLHPELSTSKFGHIWAQFPSGFDSGFPWPIRQSRSNVISSLRTLIHFDFFLFVRIPSHWLGPPSCQTQLAGSSPPRAACKRSYSAWRNFLRIQIVSIILTWFLQNATSPPSNLHTFFAPVQLVSSFVFKTIKSTQEELTTEANKEKPKRFIF